MYPAEKNGSAWKLGRSDQAWENDGCIKIQRRDTNEGGNRSDRNFRASRTSRKNKDDDVYERRFSFTKENGVTTDDDVYHYICERLKLKGETENMGVCTKERKGVAAEVLMATPCTNSLGGQSEGHKHEGCGGRRLCWKFAAVFGRERAAIGDVCYYIC